MNTDDLIKALAADTKTVKPPIAATLWVAFAAGTILAVAMFYELLAVRSDFVYAITHEPRFMFKFAFLLSLMIPALLIVLRLARPEGEIGALKWLLAVPLVLLAVAVAIEMQAVPPEHWHISAMGSMPVACMKYIPILSMAPLVAALIALRNGATTRPWAAGAAAGLFSAAIGATLYATFCVDDSPMFLAIWYVTGVAIVVAIGAAVGAKLLRW